MNTAKELPDLYVRKVRGMGRGVFAGRAYRAGEVIEVCPVVRIPAQPEGDGGKALEHYVFEWDEGTGELANALCDFGFDGRPRETVPEHCRDVVSFFLADVVEVENDGYSSPQSTQR
ncbi:lysine methyltransferase : [Gemmata massiliana]|uniref:Lysine methyltransferase n=1 Tax=Gemmata massiliana TaxID=1210884 RepID=A0A6P2DE50_9BACT|nr:SET domain-containing protein [Gemmata massiliana]VTS00471.1 lysine methyltransferase : [Gemmata massiliana]